MFCSLKEYKWFGKPAAANLEHFRRHFRNWLSNADDSVLQSQCPAVLPVGGAEESRAKSQSTIKFVLDHNAHYINRMNACS
jgi:hypothetical protein